MKVCLAEPEWPASNFTYVPTALLQLATALDRSGHQVVVSNTPVDCDVLCISATMPQYNDALRIAHSFDAGIKILGGAYITTSPMDAMSSLFTYGIMGAGELPLVSLLDGTDPDRIEGLVQRKRGSVVLPDRRSEIKGLIEPHYKWISLGKRVNFSLEQQNGMKSGIWKGLARRGYWIQFSCRTRSVRWKPARAIREEIDELMSFGVREVVVVDDPFGVDSHMFTLWNVANDLDSFDKWFCRLRPDVIERNNLDIALSGHRCVCEIDILSGSDRILSEHTKMDIEYVYDTIKKFGKLPTTVHVTIGVPGETVDSLKQTGVFLRRLGLPAKVTTFVAYPGMYEYERVGRFSRFGFHITGSLCTDFAIHDTEPIRCIPWESGTIDTSDFISLRNEMVEEFNKE